MYIRIESCHNFNYKSCRTSLIVTSLPSFSFNPNFLIDIKDPSLPILMESFKSDSNWIKDFSGDKTEQYNNVAIAILQIVVRYLPIQIDYAERGVAWPSCYVRIGFESNSRTRAYPEYLPTESSRYCPGNRSERADEETNPIKYVSRWPLSRTRSNVK